MANEAIPDPEAFEEERDDSPEAPSGPMGEESVRAAIKELVQQAVTYQDEDLKPKRVEATKYFKGEPFGNEEKGRSQVISTDVRDTILGVMPSLMRVFHGPERAVEIAPNRADAVKHAEEATDYLYYIYNDDNPGFLETYNWLLDGFVRTVGIMKWWWEDSDRTETYRLTGITEEQLKLLEAEEGVGYKVNREYDVSVEPGAPAVRMYDCEVTKVHKEGRARFRCISPEEGIWSRNARTVEDATLFGHRRTLTVGEAFKDGIASWELLLEHAGQTTELEFDDERRARDDSGNSRSDEDATPMDPSSRPIEVGEMWVRMDVDGDGIPELRKFWVIGTNHYVVDPEGEPVNERPFALFCPYPEPHTIGGLSMADMTKDVQRIKSALLRGNLDSLGLALHPRSWMVEGAVNPKDMMNTEVGALIRVKAPGMVGEFAHQYVGKESFPLLGYMDEVKEQRTGQTKASNGLDADALQSSTKAAVAATLSAAQARVELLARMFAETAFRPLFKGLYQLVRENQDYARMVRLRGQFVEVDPRPWDVDMDVKVVVALGAGLTEDKMNLLMMILQEQKGLLTTLGPNNPLVGLDRYRNTLARIIELGGFRDVDSYFAPFTREQADQMRQAAEQSPPPPDPAMAVAQAEIAKAQADIQVKQKQLEFDVQKAMMEHELKARQMAQDFELKMMEMKLKYEADVRAAETKAAIDREAKQTQAQLQAAAAEQQAALQLHSTEVNAEVQRENNAMKAEVQREAAQRKAESKPSAE